ncbi:TRAP transporter small permease [Leucothrix mucor]|uniref:TRAP transporter small permease n=1 Tax=Leucothrix mucor TaxID=45248 RepID=UPI0003B40EB6|nr:TRAP transporter small permease [Leucothrix mucor]
MMSSKDSLAGDAHDASPVIDFKWVDLPGLLALWLLAVIVFTQFFTRYVLNDSLAWTEEIARYILILVAFLGAVSVSRKGTHIFLEFFYRYLSPAAGRYLSMLMDVISTAFYGYLTIMAVQLALKTRTKMASVEIPKSLLYWCVAVGLAAMTIYSVVWLVRKYRQTPEELIKELEQRALSEAME